MRSWLTASPTRRRPGAAAVVGVLLAACLGVGAGLTAAEGQGIADWPAYLEGAAHSSYNAAATAITPIDVTSLHQVWKWAIPPASKGGTRKLFASPTVVNGVVYIGIDDGFFYAVSEATQTVLWSRFLGLDITTSTQCGTLAQGIISTATVADDPVSGKATVFVNSADGNLYALNAETGAVIWKGRVDTPSKSVPDYFAWGSPLVANGNVYVGISSNCDNPLVRGGLVAFNQSTGTRVAKWLDTPAGRAGGSIWSSPVLLSNGDIVVTTGNSRPKTGQPLYTESIVSLDPATLAVLDSWQVPLAQRTQNSDFGASPTVWTATINSVPTPMVGACNKNGIFYAFVQGALSNGPVWQTTITVPYHGGANQCDSAAVFDGTQLIIGGGDATTINGVTYPGSVQSLDPATGTPLWQTGETGTIVGTPTEDGGGIVAAQTWSSTTNELGVYLLSAATGGSVGFIRTDKAMFGQAVFAGNDLVVGASGAFGLQAYTAP